MPKLGSLKYASLLLALLSSFGYADALTEDLSSPWPTLCTPQEHFLRYPYLAIEGGETTVNLQDPLYEDGVISTEKGGVIQTSEMRIQARSMRYTRRATEQGLEWSIYCEGDLLIDYQEHVLVGKKLFYDFVTQSGILVEGKSAAPPWYVGGREILLTSERGLKITDGYITTSEGPYKEVQLLSNCITIDRDQILSASNIQLRVECIPLLWFPKVKLNFKNLGESPLAFNFGWGGFLGSHLGVRYHFLNWGDLYGFARLDAYVKRGIGAGIETEFAPLNSSTEIYTRNYYAHDISILDPLKRDRYRFEGTVFHRFLPKTYLSGMYDVVSDPEMAANYRAKDFDLETAGRTELTLHHETPLWVANLFGRARVNTFQSVNQELPTLDWKWHPISWQGFILDNHLRLSYLDYLFSKEVLERRPYAANFHSSRIAATPRLYYPYHLGPFTGNVGIGGVGIAYSNSPTRGALNGQPQQGGSVGQALGTFEASAEIDSYLYTSRFKHLFTPYASYKLWTHPRSSLNDHYLFTIRDAYAHYQLVRVGVRNSFFSLNPCKGRSLFLDLWANLFFDRFHQNSTLPKLYLHAEWMPLKTIFMELETAWNFQENLLDFYNHRLEWTLSRDLACGVEYRHRSAYAWRKADFYNFLLEEVYSNKELLHTPLSDRRDTFLLRLFYRWSPDWSGRVQLRHGWHRKRVPNYLEYEMDLYRTLFDHWLLNLNYEKREADHRFSCTIKLSPSATP